MKNQVKIFFFVILLIFSGHTGYAQYNKQQADSVKLNQKKAESSASSNDKVTKDDPGKPDNDNQKSNGNTTVKQLKGARPDMSKTRGARPPYIERQPGSGIPKGIGKPGGAVKPGRR
jgi:hypothetical protein